MAAGLQDASHFSRHANSTRGVLSDCFSRGQDPSFPSPSTAVAVLELPHSAAQDVPLVDVQLALGATSEDICVEWAATPPQSLIKSLPSDLTLADVALEPATADKSYSPMPAKVDLARGYSSLFSHNLTAPDSRARCAAPHQHICGQLLHGSRQGHAACNLGRALFSVPAGNLLLPPFKHPARLGSPIANCLMRASNKGKLLP